MKKTIKTMLALMAGALTFSACSSDDFAGQENTIRETEAKVFTASQEEDNSATSRSSVSTDGKKINWTADDKVTVWDGTAKNEFNATPDATPTSATLTGDVTKGTTSFTAVYPNSVGQKCTYTDAAITGLVIPTTQTATENSFDPAAAIMTATNTGNSFSFKNVCSFLKITTNAAYTKIVVTSNRIAPIAGTFSVANYGTEPTLTATDGTNAITLQPVFGSTEIAAGTYYIAIAPTANVMQFAVDCYTSTGVVEKVKASTTASTFVRNKIYNLGNTSTWSALDANLLPGWFSVSDTKQVHFAKSNIYWDGSALKFEANQITYPTSWNANHVGHFYWTVDKANSYCQTYPATITPAVTDAPWFKECVTVEGIGGLRVLTGGDNGEYKYLISTRGEGKLYKYGVTVGSATNCLILAPDNFVGTLKASYTEVELKDYDLVCLPAAGNRSGNNIISDVDYGDYWSATPDASNASHAYHMIFDDSSVNPASNDHYRKYGHSLRLIKDAGVTDGDTQAYGDGGSLTVWE